MKYEELKTKSTDELSQMAYNLAKSMYSLKIQKKLNQLTNTAQIRTHRRDLARVLMKLADAKKSKGK